MITLKRNLKNVKANILKDLISHTQKRKVEDKENQYDKSN